MQARLLFGKAPQPGDNQAGLLRGAAAGSSGRRSSERPAESGTERRRRDVGSSGAAGVVSRTIVSRTSQGAAPPQEFSPRGARC